LRTSPRGSGPSARSARPWRGWRFPGPFSLVGRLVGAALASVGLLLAACPSGERERREPATSHQGGTASTVDSTAVSELAYITNEDSRTLSIIETSTNRVVATIPVGTRPRGVRAARDGRFVYVALSGSPRCPPSMSDEECDKIASDKTQDGIAEVDAATRTVRRILPGGSDPEQFDVAHDGSRLFVANEDAGVASIVDVQTAKVEQAVPVGQEPEGVRVTPDGKVVYVTSESGRMLTKLDAVTGRVLGHVTVDRRPRDLVYSPDGSRAYVSAEVGGTLSIVDVAADSVISVLPMPAGSRPMGLAISRDGSRVYLATGRGGTVQVIDVPTAKIIASIKVGTRPWGIGLTRDGKYLYTANGPSNDVSVIDTDALRVVATIPVGRLPWGVAIAPAPPGGKPQP